VPEPGATARPAREPGRPEIFGVPVDPLPAAEALERAWALLEAAAPGRPALVLTPNPELVMRARTDPELLAAARAADLALPDGVGVVWALRRRGIPVPERVPGIDFMWALLGRAAREGRPVYLLGARPEVVAEAARRAAAALPGLRVAGYAHGYFPPEEEAEAVRRVARSGAELLFVGMGVPAQERLLYRRRGELGAVRLAMAVGGSLDVLAGVARRAPVALRRLGLEWLWRLAAQPWRWRRQLALPRFAWAVWRQGRGR
jgi:N-acetylglucosaminyldiphosphoundecaprenol N-acetyl-beta-D-mannosaminyltransferase